MAGRPTEQSLVPGLIAWASDGAPHHRRGILPKMSIVVLILSLPAARRAFLRDLADVGL